MEEANTTHWELIAKYLRGENSPEEKETLFTWVNQRPENRELFNELNNLWNATGWRSTGWRSTGWESLNTDDVFQPDVDRAWQRFKMDVKLEQSQAKMEPPEPKVVPLRPKGTPWLRQLTRVAATIVLVLGAIFWVRFFFSDSQLPVLTLATQKDKRVIYLPDSSKVYLNRHSQLTYTIGFGDGKRVVNLTGEAFFEVRKAAGKSFTIYSQNAKTEVLGTSFNVRAYPNEKKVEVEVTTGKVAFSIRNGQDNSKVYLTSGYKGELTARNAMTKAVVEDPNGIAWKNERLSFSNMSLSKVVATLEKYFGVTIRTDNPQLLQCRFTGSFERPELEEILEVLKVSANLSYSVNQRQYTLSGQGCP